MARSIHAATAAVGDSALQAEIALATPIQPVPALLSGLYEWRRLPIPPHGPSPNVTADQESSAAGQAPDDGAMLAPIPIPLFQREELRLDVDGPYPQMAASGEIRGGLKRRLHWIARLKATGPNRWAGAIWFKHGDAALLPHTQVEISVSGVLGLVRTAVAKFTAPGSVRVRTYQYASRYHHPVEFEFDSASDTTAVTEIETCAHPNRPATLPCEKLSIDTVYRRAGFEVRASGGAGVIPVTSAGANASWSDAEMHDAMQIYWTRFADKAQWSLWVLFAGLHDMGSGLGGIMFDDIGPNHRQGTALFNKAFISQAPADDPNPDAWVKRMKFWTACHEMGHAFNLAHSWQKALGTPWISLADEPEARSFMNYPYRVSGGQTAFFADFAYRFSDAELLFMRHAPREFVQMGNADWFDHHGFEQAEMSAEPKLRLELRVNREAAVFEFLEPVMLEMKLTNVSEGPVIVDRGVLATGDGICVVIKKRGRAARQWAPFATYCLKPTPTVLTPGESLYESLFAAVGQNGWDLSEPGIYEIQMLVRIGEEDTVSNPVILKILPAVDRTEEVLAQDFFSEDVGRVLTFDGTRALDAANAVLEEVIARLPGRRAAVHAHVALGSPLAQGFKSLQLPDGRRQMTSAADDGGAFKVEAARQADARKHMEAALEVDPAVAAETLGHVDYKAYADRHSEWLAKRGESDAASKAQAAMHKALAGRGVISRVLTEIEQRRDAYGGGRTARRKTGRRK